MRWSSLIYFWLLADRFAAQLLVMISQVRRHSLVSRMRGRVGIAAPRVAVCAEVPWQWRVLAAAAASGAIVMFAAWAYDAGRRSASGWAAGSGRLDELHERLSRLENEVTRLKVPVSALQMGEVAQRQLTAQVQALETENSRIKEESGVLERLVNGDGKAGSSASVTIDRLRVIPAGQGRYRYRFIATQNGEARGREFKGSIQLAVVTAAGRTLVIPDANDHQTEKFAIAFRRFKGIEGTFQLPADTRPQSVELRIVQHGVVVAAGTARV